MPKEKTITVYQYAELPTEKAKNRARDWFLECDEISTEEVLESLKALFKNCSGVKLTDWSIGTYSPSYLKVTFAQDGAEDLKGARAFAWLENNLLAGVRIPWTGQKRRELAQYGVWYRPGLVKPCPFTGVCFDDDFLDALRASLKAGDTLKDAFEDLARHAQKLLEAEYEYHQSEEYVSEMMEANEYEFDEDGRRV